MTDELLALQDADFGWVEPLETIWSDATTADAGPNQDFADQLITELAKLTAAANPPGRAFPRSSRHRQDAPRRRVASPGMGGALLVRYAGRGRHH